MRMVIFKAGSFSLSKAHQLLLLPTCDPDSLERFFAALRSLAAGPAAGHAVVGRLHPHAAHAITTRRRAAQPIPTSTAYLLTRRRRGSNQGPRRRWVRVHSELRMCSPWCRGTPIYPAGRPGCSGALPLPWSGDAHHFALDGTWTALLDCWLSSVGVSDHVGAVKKLDMFLKARGELFPAPLVRKNY